MEKELVLIWTISKDSINSTFLRRSGLISEGSIFKLFSIALYRLYRHSAANNDPYE